MKYGMGPGVAREVVRAGACGQYAREPEIRDKMNIGQNRCICARIQKLLQDYFSHCMRESMK